MVDWEQRKKGPRLEYWLEALLDSQSGFVSASKSACLLENQLERHSALRSEPKSDTELGLLWETVTEIHSAQEMATL